jgi:hypothetical protein
VRTPIKRGVSHDIPPVLVPFVFACQLPTREAGTRAERAVNEARILHRRYIGDICLLPHFAILVLAQQWASRNPIGRMPEPCERLQCPYKRSWM